MDWMAITGLIVAGLALMAVEVYVPGFVLGSIGLVLMILAGVFTYKAYGGNAALLVVSVEVALSIAVVLAALKWFPQTATGKKMILAATQTGVRSQTQRAPDLVGREGIAHTVLRPTGVAVVDGKRLDVVAESGMIERGSPVKVVAVEENRVLVRKI